MNLLDELKKMNKRAETTLLKELLYLAIGAIALIVIFAAGSKLYAIVTNQPDKTSVNNFERLVQEISFAMDDYKSFKDDASKVTSYTKEIPIRIDKNLGIKFYDANSDDAQKYCKNRNQICVCIAYITTFLDNKAPYKCETIDESKGFRFDKIDAPVNQAGLIVSEGIGSYILSFPTFNTIYVKFTGSAVSDDAASLNMNDFCSSTNDPSACMSYNAFGGKSSDFPDGSPFGPASDGTIITSGYEAEYYAVFVSEHAKGINPKNPHMGIDIIPAKTLDVFKNKPVFFATCDGKAESMKNGDINIVRLICNDGHIVRFLHDDYHFVTTTPTDVKYGQPLGIMGNSGAGSGKSTGKHVHYEVMNSNGNENPIRYIENSEIYNPDSSDEAKEINCQINGCSIKTSKTFKDTTDDCISSCYPDCCTFICKSRSTCPTTQSTSTPVVPPMK